jgi:hypothetical protein
MTSRKLFDMGWLWRLARRAALAAVLVLLTLIVGGALDARWRLPDLKAWHRVRLDDVRASTLNDTFTVPQYLAREEQLFAQVRAFESTIEAAERTPVNRYHPGSLSHPSSAGRDWNRSFETEPAVIRGGALLVHGLTDSPYSMRAVADVLRDRGIYSLALRMPGMAPSHRASSPRPGRTGSPPCAWESGTCKAGSPPEVRSSSSAIPTAARWR